MTSIYADTREFQLRFRSLFREGRGYAFPCDSTGRVAVDQLSAQARVNYFFASALVGREFEAGVVVTVPQSSAA